MTLMVELATGNGAGSLRAGSGIGATPRDGAGIRAARSGASAPRDGVCYPGPGDDVLPGDPCSIIDDKIRGHGRESCGFQAIRLWRRDWFPF